MSRAAIAGARRTVVKIGSSSLTERGRLDPARLDAIVDAIAARHGAGQQVVVVSSGAIAAGIGPLGLHGPAARPGHPAGGGIGRAAAAGRALRGVVRPLRAAGRPGAAHRRRPAPARALPQRAAHPRAAAQPRRDPDRQRERHRRHRTRSGSATTTGSPRWSPTSCRPTRSSCSRTSTASTPASPDVPGATLIEDVREPADLAEVQVARQQQRGRHRRHGDEARRGRDRDRRGHPGAARRGRPSIGPALAGDDRHRLPPGRRPQRDPAVLAAPRDDAARAAGARSGRGRRRRRSGGRRCCRPGSPRSPASSTPAIRSSWPTRTGWSLARGLVGYDAADLPVLLGRKTSDLPAEFRREVVHRDDLVLL